MLVKNVTGLAGNNTGGEGHIPLPHSPITLHTLHLIFYVPCLFHTLSLFAPFLDVLVVNVVVNVAVVVVVVIVAHNGK